MRYGSLKSYLAERGPGDQEDEDGRPYMKSEFFREPLPAGAVEALVERFVRDAGPGRRGSSTSCPGAAPTTACLRTPPRSHTARSSSCSSTLSSSRPASMQPRPRRARLAVGLVGARAPLRLGRRLRELPDAELRDEQRACWGGNLERMRRVKERYDPEAVLG